MGEQKKPELGAKVRALEVAFYAMTGRYVEREDTPEVIKATAADVAWRLKRAEALETAFYDLTGFHAERSPDEIREITARERSSKLSDLSTRAAALDAAFRKTTSCDPDKLIPDQIRAVGENVRRDRAAVESRLRALEVAFYTLTGHQSADHTPEDIQSIAAQERAASSLTARKLSNTSAREDALARAFGMLTKTAPETLSPEDIEEVAKITNAERKEARRAATDVAWKQRETKARLNALAGAFEKVTGQKIEEIDSVLYVDGLALGAYADRFSQAIEKIKATARATAEEILHHAAERMAERNART